MAFRLTKNVLANASRARVAASAPRATGGVFTVASAAARRGMASAASGSAHNTASSDKPWIIVSALIFGPALLYLISPEARKGASSGHGDHSSASKHASSPVLMKDDEGSVADVRQTMSLAESDDVPKADTSPNETPVAAVAKRIYGGTDEETATLISSALAALGGKPEEAHKEEGHKEEEHYAPTDGESKEQKRGTFQQEGETGPTNMGPARAAAVRGKTPKDQKEAYSA